MLYYYLIDTSLKIKDTPILPIIYVFVYTSLLTDKFSKC